MFPFISGTIYNTGKLNEMNQKWLQKKELGNWKNKELTPEERQLQQFREQIEADRKNREMSAITSKIKDGRTLTPEEIDYLRKNNPQALRDYEEIKIERENYERQIRNCRTKEEVEQVKVQKMNSYLVQAKEISSNPHIPGNKKLELMCKLQGKLNNIQKAHVEFIRSAFYLNMPTEEELAQEEKKKVESSEMDNRQVKASSRDDYESHILQTEENAEGEGEDSDSLMKVGGSFERFVEGEVAEPVTVKPSQVVQYEDIKAVIDDFWKKQGPRPGKLDLLL